MELSPKFAYLPNGIIREIVAYTGATFKKRNGKYMGQIPKTDPRFALLLKIPKKKMNVTNLPQLLPNCKYFNAWVHLKPFGHPAVRLSVFGVTYINDPILGNRETIQYECRTRDRNGDERYETYEYYRKNASFTERLSDATQNSDSLSSATFGSPVEGLSGPPTRIPKGNSSTDEKLDCMMSEYDSMLSKIDKIQKSIDQLKPPLCLLQNVCIMFGMFTTGFIIQYFR
jgi:hypothetical protein